MMKPEDVPDEWAALAEEARARRRNELYALGLPPSGGLEDACMAAAIAAAAPLIAKAEREACAAMVDCGCELRHAVLQAVAANGHNCAARWNLCGYSNCAALDAAAIRART